MKCLKCQFENPEGRKFCREFEAEHWIQKAAEADQRNRMMFDLERITLFTQSSSNEKATD